MTGIPVAGRATYGLADFIGVFLFGCGGSDDQAGAPMDPGTVKTFAERCSALAGSAIPAADIALPTKGANITSAVSGDIRPLHPGYRGRTVISDIG